MKANHSQMSLIGVVVLVGLASLLFWQCGGHEEIVGTYRAIDASTHSGISATLELQANGKGLWSIETDNASFRWNRDQNSIRLHTHTGGVIQGIIDGETIRIDIPGTGEISFKRER